MLYIDESGPADATAIVWLHGGGLSSRMWQPQIERLAGFHHLAPDLPEQGRSAAIQPFTLAGAAAAVAALIRARVPGGRAHVVGLSLGGAVALTLLRIAPGCVDHLIVSGTAAGLGPLLGRLAKASAPLYRLIAPERLVDAMLRQQRIPPEYHALCRADLLQTSNPVFTMHYVDELMKMELPTAGSAPVLAAVGARETRPARRAARTLVARLGARGVIAPGLGHVWSLEAPDLFAAMVRAWIGDAPLPAALQPLR